MGKHPPFKAANDLRYYKTVFMAPPWPEMYEHDKERKQSFDEAARNAPMRSVYAALGYELIAIPKLSAIEGQCS